MTFPATSANLLSKLKAGNNDDPQWQFSWKRFLELYKTPIEAMARASYHHHTGGHIPAKSFIDDAVANTVADFFSKSHQRYDAQKGRLRTFLRVITNARVIDLLRKERPLDHQALPNPDCPANGSAELPAITQEEIATFHQAILDTLVEDLREHIPMRQFEIFERVKLLDHPPEKVATDLGLTRAMIDRYIHKAMTKLRQLAAQSEYQEEFYD